MCTGITITVAILTALPTWTRARCAIKLAGSLNLRKKFKQKSRKTNGSAVCVVYYKVFFVLKKCLSCEEPSFEISTGKVKVQPDEVQTELVYNCCKMIDKTDLNNVHSAICIACETED